MLRVAAIPRVKLVRRVRVDATTFLTVYVVLLLGIPSRLIFRPLGASGTPANVLGIVGLCWWLGARLVPRLGVARGTQPVRIMLLLFFCAVVCSMAALYLRPFDPKEASAFNRGVLVLWGSAGVALLAADGIRTLERLEALLQRLVYGATGLAGVGILQFFTGFNIANLFHIPGLSPNFAIGLIDERSIFRRVQGTAIHPIEFGVVLALAFPVAIHYALVAPRGKRLVAWGCGATIAVAIPMSLSRAAVVGVTAGSIMLFAAFTPPQRKRAVIVAAGFAAVMRVLVPGLLGTVRSLFTNIASDPSTTGRTGRYGVAGHYVKLAPLFGRGFFTFLPDKYITFDNQYLETVVDTGLVGLAILIALFLVGIFMARGARRRSRDPRTRGLAQALAGTMLAAMLVFATFDALSFSMATGITFLLFGCSGGLWRFVKEGESQY